MTQPFPFTSAALFRRIRDARLELLTDPRSKRGQRYRFDALVAALTLGMTTQATSLREVEDLTDNLSPSLRRRTHIHKRISDTKLRDTIKDIDYDELRSCLHRVVKAEARRGNLDSTVLPCSVLAIDGKEFAPHDDLDHDKVMAVRPKEHPSFGRIRVHRVHLVSSHACPCVDQLPIKGDSNESGTIFDTAHSVLRQWGHTKLCDMLAMDAGNCTLAAASLIDGWGKKYLMRLKANQGTMWDFTQKYLAPLKRAKAQMVKVERARGGEIERRVYRLELHGGLHTWNHLRQVVRIQTLRFKTDEQGNRVQVGKEGNRYWLSNAEHKEFDSHAWLSLTRRYWRIENEGNWSADAVWGEDGSRPRWAMWADGVLMVGLLRMIGLTIVSVLRRIAQQRQRGRAKSWRVCALKIYAALLMDVPRSLASS